MTRDEARAAVRAAEEQVAAQARRLEQAEMELNAARAASWRATRVLDAARARERLARAPDPGALEAGLLSLQWAEADREGRVYALDQAERLIAARLVIWDPPARHRRRDSWRLSAEGSRCREALLRDPDRARDPGEGA